MEIGIFANTILEKNFCSKSLIMDTLHEVSFFLSDTVVSNLTINLLKNYE